MFHVNTSTGEAGACSAKQGNCPFGGMNVHFTTVEAARESFEGSMKGNELKTVKKDGRSLRQNWPDLELYRGVIGRYDEVFVHPQGKIVIADGDTGVLKVLRNGAKASTSGTLDDLRDGRGNWKQVKYQTEELRTPEAYKLDYENGDAGKPGASTPQAPPSAKELANVSAGYPADSQLDASNTGVLQQNSRKSEWSMSERGSRPGSAILTVNERANPHKDMKTSEWLTGWNYKRSDGTESTSAIEVWRGESSPGKFNYKLVATSGHTIEALGSSCGFFADQSGASMGGRWSLVGAFESREGGEAIGEIPDKKMPLYTYK